ncbi:MAG: phosphoenolpyruvate--protein phosphotransferase, partial [Selenomonadales bacterium]|nr:phosphoenolpyruvate--protein phosphotransferase [Selenomonadales bacterium]
MIVMQGQGVSSGIAIAPIAFYKRQSVVEEKTSVCADEEWQRFCTASQKAQSELERLTEKARQEAGEEASLLFETHQMMLDDEDYRDAIEAKIKEDNLSAIRAVQAVTDQFANMFRAMQDSYMQAREADIKDIGMRLIRILSGQENHRLSFEESVILAADDLAPSETIQLDKSKIVGFLLSGGAAAGHTAILARTMGIPAVIGLGKSLLSSYEGRMAILDGGTGSVIVDPNEDMLKRYRERKKQDAEKQSWMQELKGKPNRTRDGQEVRVYCNISTPNDVHAVMANDGGGIGLFRSEFLYLNSDDYPTEEEQFEAYKSVLADMAGKRVIIRTCDIGADKQIDYFGLPKEDNPAMGMRALRISLSRPLFFRSQLRALYRASVFGRLGIMFPMVTSVWEVREAKKCCESVKQELKKEGIPYKNDVELGIMIETPAAALISDKLAKEVDFFSCGTNDLVQYTLACDRQNHDLGRFYDPHHLSLLRLIKLATDNAHQNGIWIGICGELAADTTLT